MSALTLLAGAGYGAAAALVYGIVSLRVARRGASNAEVRLAGGLYAVWWAGVATTASLVAVGNLAGAFGIDDLPFHIALNYLLLLAACVSVWGLLYYVVYLLWGNGGRALTVLTVFYAANFLLVLVHLTLASPAAVEIGRWRTQLVLEGPWAPGQTLAWGVLVYAPLLLAVFGYFTVYFRASEPTVRYRVVAVTLAVLVWFESLLLSRVPSLADADAWQVAGHLATFASALIVLVAYHPPAWVARRLGLEELPGDPSS